MYYAKSLTLTNDSLVAAVFKAFLRKGGSPFSLECEAFTMAPGETRDTQFSLDEIDRYDDDEYTYCDECIVEMLRSLDSKGTKTPILPSPSASALWT